MRTTSSAIIEQIQPLAGYFESLSKSKMTAIGSVVEFPATNATVSLPDIEIFVDLKDFIDWDAELARLEKEKSRTEGLITGKEKKLSNANFVERAPEEVVQKEKESLVQLAEQLKTIEDAIAKLNEAKPG